MQFHIPSVVHAVPAVIAEPEPVVPVLAGVAAGETGVDATGAGEPASCDAAALDGETTGAEVACVPVDEVGIVAKTPPEKAVFVPTGADEACVGAGVVAAAAGDPDADVPVAATATAAAHPDPVGVLRAEEVARPSCSRESPGFGKITSVALMVPQPLPIFAVKILGKALKAAWSRSMSCV